MFSLQTIIILKFNQTNSKINFSIFFLFLMGDNIKVLFKKVLNDKDQSQNHIKHLYITTQNTD